MVPTIDVAALFGPAGSARAAVDRAIAAAAADIGFLTISGLGAHAPVGPEARAALLGIFTLEEAGLRALWRRKFAPGNPNVYRGFFPLQPGNVTAKQGIDLGPDLVYGTSVVHADDPLREPTPLPEEAELPGWRVAVRRYYVAMEQVSRALMQSVARSLGSRSIISTPRSSADCRRCASSTTRRALPPSSSAPILPCGSSTGASGVIWRARRTPIPGF